MVQAREKMKRTNTNLTTKNGSLSTIILQLYYPEQKHISISYIMPTTTINNIYLSEQTSFIAYLHLTVAQALEMGKHQYQYYDVCTDSTMIQQVPR